MRCAPLAALILLPATAAAQPLLFDDFDGDALAPNWGHVPSRWQYNVSNGMLNVTALTYPSNPQSNSNAAAMASLFETQMDFRIDVWMGWDGGDPPEGIEFTPLAASGHILATFGYRNEPTQGPPRIVMGAGSMYAASIPSPGPGMHHFTLTRSGDQFEFYLNGAFLVAFPDDWERPASVMFFSFGGPYPGQLGALHVDRVRVVPAPYSAAVLGTVLILGRIRRMRRET